MRKIVWVVAAAVIAVPTVALADSSTARSTAEKQCRMERQTMGTATFKATYGTNKNKSNAFGKCVSHRAAQNTSDQSQAQARAEAQCRSQQTADPSAFKEKYGTNHNKANAFGRCVSQTAQSMSSKDESTQVSDEQNAAQQCRSQQTADPAAFKDKYGTNKNKSNAFGKCVSQTAHATEHQQSGS
jgi:hypothetical protein